MTRRPTVRALVQRLRSSGAIGFRDRWHDHVRRDVVVWLALGVDPPSRSQNKTLHEITGRAVVHGHGHALGVGQYARRDAGKAEPVYLSDFERMRFTGAKISRMQSDGRIRGSFRKFVAAIFAVESVMVGV